MLFYDKYTSCFAESLSEKQERIEQQAQEEKIKYKKPLIN